MFYFIFLMYNWYVQLCDDYYFHQLIPMTNVPSHNDVPQSSSMGHAVDGQDASQNHQYECIPEYFLTVTRHRHSPIVCHHSHQWYHQTNSDACSPPPSVTSAQEESSIPLFVSAIPKGSRKREETSSSSTKSMMVGWIRSNSTFDNNENQLKNEIVFYLS